MRLVCLAIAVGLAGLAACESKPESPTAPAPTVPTVAGRWEGVYTVTGCVAGAQCVPSPCRLLLGSSYRLQLTLEQDGAELKGHIDDELDQPFFILPGEVGGTIDSGGRVALTGAIVRADKVTHYKGQWADISFDTALQSGAATMTGTYVKDWQTFQPSCTSKLTHRFDSFARIP